MSVPRSPRNADSVYWRRDSAGPGMGFDALWTDAVPPAILATRAREAMSDAQIRELGPPLPQIIRNPPRLGYYDGQPTSTDIFKLRRNIVPFAPVGQDGGGAIATSNPSNYMWW